TPRRPSSARRHGLRAPRPLQARHPPACSTPPTRAPGDAMACTLGISAHYHDAAAALVLDGQVIAAVQEERLSRIKNDPSLPIAAARACLDLAGLDPRDVDTLAFYEEPFAKLERVLVHLVRGLPRTWRAFPRALASQLGGKLW